MTHALCLVTFFTIVAIAFSVTSDVAETLAAAKKETTFKVTPSAGKGGSITPSKAVTVKSGETVTFTVKGATEGVNVTVEGCGGKLDGTTYTTGPITKSCKVEAKFIIPTFTVTPIPSQGGIIAPPKPIKVKAGERQKFTVNPTGGYKLAVVEGTCGGELTKTHFVTNPVTADCTVEPKFYRSGCYFTSVPAHSLTAERGSCGFFTNSSDPFFKKCNVGCETGFTRSKKEVECKSTSNVSLGLEPSWTCGCYFKSIPDGTSKTAPSCGAYGDAANTFGFNCTVECDSGLKIVGSSLVKCVGIGGAITATWTCASSQRAASVDRSFFVSESPNQPQEAAAPTVAGGNKTLIWGVVGAVYAVFALSTIIIAAIFLLIKRRQPMIE